MPSYKGSTLRGGFGITFKHIVCTRDNKNCSECILRESCLYSYIFETSPPKDTEIMRKYESIPHPFIIEPPIDEKRYYKEGEEIEFRLILIGNVIDYLPYFIYTFEELGKIGIGKERGKFTLQRVENTIESEKVYNCDSNKINSFRAEEIDLFPTDFNQSDQDNKINNIRLCFQTPTRIY